MPTILVVDDEPALRRVVRRALERAGMKVLDADSSDAALAIVGGAPRIDAIVCDVMMPDADGLQLYDEIVARQPALRERVVFLTGSAHDPAVHDPIEQRGVPLLSKLDDLALLVDAVRVALIRGRTTDEPAGGR